jgi:hypothetical protein
MLFFIPEKSYKKSWDKLERCGAISQSHALRAQVAWTCAITNTLEAMPTDKVSIPQSISYDGLRQM